jgi:tetratricopeptide (TPR) repeat protein
MDDTVIIKNNFNIICNINKIDEAFYRDAFLNKNGNTFYRPFQTISFMFDAMISGENPLMYHLTNIFIHIATCVSLYFFFRTLKLKDITSFVFTLIFAVHPLFTDTVSVISYRGDLLIGLLGLLLFISFVKHIITGKYIYFLLHSFFFTLILFTKENSIVFPLIPVFYFFYELKDKYSYKKLFPYFIVWFVVSVIFFIIRRIVLTDNPTNTIVGITAFIKNLPTLPIVFGKIFIPADLSTMPLFDNTSIIIGIIFLLLILYPVVKYTLGKKYLVIMGFAWFLLFTIPSMIYYIIDIEKLWPFSFHRTYLPSIGILIILAFIFEDKVAKLLSVKIITLVSIIIIAILSILAFIYCDDYKDSYSFLTCAVNHNNPFALVERGNLFFKDKKYSEALSDFNKAISIYPFPHPMTFFNRGLVESAINDHISAENDFSKAIQLNPVFGNAYLYRSKEKLIRNDFQGAFQDLNFAAKYDTLDDRVFFNLGDLFLSSGNFNEAIINYTKAINLNEASTESYNNRGIARLNLLDCNGAINDFKKVLAINPKHAQAYINMGLAYGQLNQFDNAIDCFTNAINISGNIPQAYYGRGMAKQGKNDLAGACSDWNEALRLGYAPAKEMLDKYCKK